ncbi:hypothetical protein BH24ACT19_BH24ACT19_16970 [soil metagenome]
MRRLALVFLAVFAATGLVTVAKEDGNVEAAPTYSQRVDNSDEDRFKVNEGWGTSSYGVGVNGADYRFARPSNKSPSSAQFRVEIPEDGDYAVYACWPKVKGLSSAAPVEVVTSSGIERTKVNQQKNGGQWVRIGIYDMKAGDDYSIRFSPRASGKNYIGADAVKVEQVSMSAPAPQESSAPAANSEGEEVVETAKEYDGTVYRLGGASRSGMDCSGLTMLVYEEFGVTLPHSMTRQYDEGSTVPKGQEQPGDLAFFDEHDDGISHVGIYAGNGKIVHASDYFDEVVESDMKDLDGYVGATRLI